MPEENEYIRVISAFYRKSLILESQSDFHPVLYFYFIDSLAHIDFSLNTLAYNYHSLRNIMNMEYLRWRIDEKKKGDRGRFGEFINWLKEHHRQKFDTLPMVWKSVYDKDSVVSYRSFRIVLDPDSNQPLPAQFFRDAVDEFFSQKFLKSLYQDASLARLFDEFIAQS